LGVGSERPRSLRWRQRRLAERDGIRPPRSPYGGRGRTST
jgi:hypothetical protein